VREFVIHHPTEIVFLNIQNMIYFSGLTGKGWCSDPFSCRDYWATKDRIQQVVQEMFGDCDGTILLCDVDLTKTVGELVQTGRLIIHSNSDAVADESEKRIHRTKEIYTAPYYAQNNLEGLKERLLDDTEAQSLSSDTDIMIGHQWIFTAQAGDYLKSIFSYWGNGAEIGTWPYGDTVLGFDNSFAKAANAYGCQSLACFAEVASAASFDAIWDQVRAKYSRSNFLMLDFADRPGGMEFIMRANQEVTGINPDTQNP